MNGLVSRIRMMVCVIGAAIVCGLTFTTTAEGTTIYAFDGFSLAATTTTPHTIASDFSLSNGGACAAIGGNVACGGYGDSTSEFTVQPNVGVSLTITGLSFDEENGGSFGPTAFEVFTSADNFMSPIISGALAPSALTFTNHAASLSLTDVTARFVVRFVTTGRGNQSPKSPWFVDNVTLNVDAVPSDIPEPTTLVLLGTGLVGAVVNRRAGKIRMSNQ